MDRPMIDLKPARSYPLGSLMPGVVRRVSATVQSHGVSAAKVHETGSSHSPLAADNAAAFCRQARKLRADHEGDPIRMYRRLSQLSVTAAPEQESPPGPEQAFASRVDRTLKAQPKSPLRYSQRLALLKEADRCGIGRFEANLIIASVQHRLKLETPAYTPRKALRLPGVFACLLLQTLIVWCVWHVMRS